MFPTTLPYYWVDAFSSQLFGGNPAAVCPLKDGWPEDSLLQAIAFENNISETAYFLPLEDGRFHLRWFTPGREVDLCGHATVASAYVLMEHLDPGRKEVRFESRSGELRVTREGDLFVLDFPARPPRAVEAPAGMTEALRVPDGQRVESYLGHYHMMVLPNESQVRELQPNFNELAKVEAFGAIVTAVADPGVPYDFVSRFFAPRAGINEDPVTGSAHTTLTPYWAQKLGKDVLQARQVSQRGGELRCTNAGDRVLIAGRATLFSTGTIHLQGSSI